jgi:hypothetical protein
MSYTHVFSSYIAKNTMQNHDFAQICFCVALMGMTTLKVAGTAQAPYTTATSCMS